MSEQTVGLSNSVPSRRALLKGAGAGLVLSFSASHVGHAAAAAPAAAPARPPVPPLASPFSGFLQIAPDGKIAIYSGGAELGQGIFTNLPKILAEELEVDFDQVECKLPYGDAKALGVGGRQTIGGSTSTLGYFPIMRKAGAAAREMLVAAAAAQWKVPVEQCRTVQGRIIHDLSERVLTYGQVATAAAKLPVPQEPKLKDKADFKLIGHTVLRKDTPPKVDGSAQFGADIKVPGLIGAAVVMAPRVGATLALFDPASVQGMSGVIKVVPLTDPDKNLSAVGVLAETYWQARRAADALHVMWTGGDPTLSSAKISQSMRELLKDDSKAQTPPKGGKDGDVAAAMSASGVKTMDVTYEAPYMAHACMEPMVITAQVKDGACMVWAPTQQPDVLRKTASDLTGIPREKVTVQTTFLGGGFGRKWEMDYPTQVIQLAMAAGGRPVCLQWTREQDIQNDYYRPASIVRLRGAVDAQGKATSFQARAVTQSIVNYKRMAPKPIFDGTAVEGFATKYAIPNTLVEWVDPGYYVPVGFWRSVGLSQNLFMAEGAIDELAHLAGRDPYEFRRELLKDKPHELKVLETVAKMAGWGRKLPQGHGLGIAFGEGFRSTYAQVAEVSVKNNELQVHKVWCALDCGLVMDPGASIAQVEGGINFGLSAALFGEITLDKGGIVQSNFTDFGMVTLRNAPDIEVELLTGGENPTGVGEAGVPAVAPAVANAIFAASGQRLRKMPLRLSGLTVADTQRPLSAS